MPVRCNKCYTIWDDDEDIPQILVVEDGNEEIIKGCDNCQTDGYLMDMEVSQ